MTLRAIITYFGVRAVSDNDSVDHTESVDVADSDNDIGTGRPATIPGVVPETIKMTIYDFGTICKSPVKSDF